MLGELANFEGDVAIKSGHHVAYIGQQPWIFPGTLRENVLFGNQYDKNKFDKVIQVCSLQKELLILSSGEDTLIGGKLGVNLSESQKSRISL